MPIDFSKYQKKAEVKPKVKPEKPTIKKNLVVEKKSKKPKKPLDIVFKNMTITQDDLWFLYRLKTGQGTRISKSKLLPQFVEVFNKNLEKQKTKKGVGIKNV